MKVLISLALIGSGLCGSAMSFLSEIVVTSPFAIIDGMELSIWLGVFFLFVFLYGIYNLISTD
jgi:hypothetical protein